MGRLKASFLESELGGSPRWRTVPGYPGRTQTHVLSPRNQLTHQRLGGSLGVHCTTDFIYIYICIGELRSSEPVFSSSFTVNTVSL